MVYVFSDLNAVVQRSARTGGTGRSTTRKPSTCKIVWQSFHWDSHQPTHMRRTLCLRAVDKGTTSNAYSTSKGHRGYTFCLQQLFVVFFADIWRLVVPRGATEFSSATTRRTMSSSSPGMLTDTSKMWLRCLKPTFPHKCNFWNGWNLDIMR